MRMVRQSSVMSLLPIDGACRPPAIAMALVGLLPLRSRQAASRHAAFCLACERATAQAASSQLLTGSAGGAQHTEKAVVFYYSKVRDAAARASCGAKKLRRTAFLQRHNVTFNPQ